MIKPRVFCLRQMLPVVSGLPQGIVLGPILFLMFINDLPTYITYGIKLFADDCVLYRPIHSVCDHLALQQYLGQLEKWASTWQMKFAPTKCFVRSITLKNSPFRFSYFLCDAQLDGPRHQKYLGVFITCTLCWQLQCEEAKKGGYDSLRDLSKKSLFVRSVC